MARALSQTVSRDLDADTLPPQLVYVNGRLVPKAEAAVSVFDSGLSFADGVFEGIRVYEGQVFRLKEHVDRLFESAGVFEIEIGMTRDEFAHEILEWLRANEVRDGFHFRPIVTRGVRLPPRLDPRFATGEPTILILGGPVEPTPSAGLRVVVSQVRRISPDALDPRVKSLNYGNNVLARLETRRRGVDDAVMLDTAGFIAEASAANVFIVRSGRLETPLPRACLPGLTRRAVIDLAAAHGIETVERDLHPGELLSADEVFLTGTSAELTPVVEVDGRTLGPGPGPITRELTKLYGELVRAEGVPIDT